MQEVEPEQAGKYRRGHFPPRPLPLRGPRTGRVRAPHEAEDSVFSTGLETTVCISFSSSASSVGRDSLPFSTVCVSLCSSPSSLAQMHLCV